MTNQSCVTVDDVTIYNNSVIANAGVDINNICGVEPNISSATLNATAPNTSWGETGIWTVVGSSASIASPSIYNSQITGMGNGENVFRWTLSRTVNSVTCTDDDFVSVSVYIPTTAVTIPDFEVCANPTDNATITANNPVNGTGLWSWEGIGSIVPSIANPLLSSTTVTNLGLNETVLRWTISLNGCTSINDLVITNNYVIADAGTDDNICVTNYTLGGNDPLTFGQSSYGYASGNWTIVNGMGTFTDHTLYNSTVTELITTPVPNNIFRWTIDKGACSDFDEVNIINNSPSTSNAGADQNICTNETTLTGNSPVIGKGQWTITAGAGTIEDSTSNQTNVSGLSSGYNTFRWSVTNQNCVTDDDVTIYNNSVIANAGVDINNICGVEPNISSATLNATAPNTSWGETGIWTVVGSSASIASPSIYNSQITGMGNGINIFRWTLSRTVNSVTCTDDDFVSVSVYIPTTAVTIPDFEVCANTTDNETITANNPVNGTGSWTLISGAATIANNEANTTTITNIGLGENIFRWTIDHNGCSSSHDLIITNNLVFADAGLPQTSLDGTASLSANNPIYGIGKWTANPPGAVFIDDTQYNTGVVGLSPGVNNLTWSITNGFCISSSDVAITYNPSNTSAGPDQQGCTDSYTMNASDPGTTGSGIWSVVQGAGSFTNPTAYNTSVTQVGRQDNVFRWTVTVGQSVSYDDVRISNYSVIAEAGPDNYTCDATYSLQGNNPIAQSIMVPNLPASGTWTTSGSASFDNINTYNSQVSNMDPDANTIIWTIDNGFCSDSDEVIITFNGVIASAELDQEICATYATMSANYPVSGYGYWEQIAGSPAIIDNSMNPTTTVSGLNSGSFTFRWTVVDGGCSAFDEVVITNSTPQDALASTPTPEVCDANGVLLGNIPNIGEHGLWIMVDAFGIITDPISASTTVQNLKPNDNTYRWTLTKGVNVTCTSSSDVSIINNQVFVSASANNQISCNGNTVLLGNDPSITQSEGVWTVNTSADITNPSLYNTSATNLLLGDNIFTWTIAKGNCSASDNITIKYELPEADAGLDQIICTNETTLAGNSPVTGKGQWTIVSGSGTIEDSTSNQTNVSGLLADGNTFRWTINNGGCSAFDDVLIMNNSFTIVAGDDLSSCGDKATLNAEDSGSGTGIWTVYQGEGVFVSNSLASTRVSNIYEGENEYIWTVERNGCVNSDTLKVTYQELPTVNFSSNPTTQTYPNATVNIENLSNQGYEFYRWDYGDGNTRLDTSRIENFSHTYDNWGEYEIRLIAGSDYCSDSTSQIIEILDPSTSIEQLSKKGVKIYPNPSSGIFTIEFINNLVPDNISITNLNGQKIYFNNKLNHSETIDLSKNGSGIYIISIKKRGQIFRMKLLVNK